MIKIDEDKKTKKEVKPQRKPKAYCKQFVMVDTPLHVVKQFCSDIKEKYGDIYWVKLMDLMTKAEAYDALMEEVKEDEEPVSQEIKKEKVMTFTGEVSNED